MEPMESLVGNTSTSFETLDDVVLHGAEHGDILGEHSHVVGRGGSRQTRGMFRRQGKTIRRGTDIDDAGSHHGAKPFAHVTLVETGAGRNVAGARWRQLTHRVKEPGAVAD